MKNLITIFCLTLFSLSTVLAQSTSYTLFEWDVVGVGIAIPVNDDDLKPGITFGGEVRFNAADNFSLGLGSDFTFFSLEELENLETDEDATVDFSSTSYLSADYYLSSTSSKRGFVGLAIGYTDIGDIEIKAKDEDATYIEGESGMSISPRVGYELGHARFLLNYNIGLKEDIADYISIKVSLTLWGGYKG